MGSMIEAINRRVSVRTYADRPLEQDTKERLQGLLQEEGPGPLGHAVRFVLVDLSEQDRKEVRHLGTYGVIRGAGLYVAGILGDTRGDMVDLGYCLEKLILRMTLLGLGTCWMGGTFNRAGFAHRIGLSGDEVIPAITPVGYAAHRKSIVDATFRRMVGADNRKPWSLLFFAGDAKAPLTREAAGPYATPLDCVRLAPSASNRQPWRIIKDSDAGTFHFFLKRTPGLGRVMKAADLQLVDIGIAMSHFELASAESGLSGTWTAQNPKAQGWEYVMTWAGQ